MSDRPDLAEVFAPLDLPQRRKTVLIAADALCLCARGNGADDTSLKLLVLAMRSPEIGIVTDEEAAVLIDHLGIGGA